VFAKRGYASARISDIVDAAGVTTPVLYHYFPSKAALYAATAADVHDLVLARWSDAIRDRTGLADRLDAIIHAAASLHREDPTLAAFIAQVPSQLGERGNLKPVADELARMQNFLEQLVADTGIPPGAASTALVHTCVVLTAGLARVATLADPISFDNVATNMRALIAGTLFSANDFVGS
jgi:AcrR family transcriptional regulator